MKYIVNISNDPAYNIALEAYAFRELSLLVNTKIPFKRLTKNIQMLMVSRSFVVCLVVALFITI